MYSLHLVPGIFTWVRYVPERGHHRRQDLFVDCPVCQNGHTGILCWDMGALRKAGKQTEE